MTQTRRATPLPSPLELKRAFPPPKTGFVAQAIAQAKKILQRQDPKLAVLVGPCSIHDPEGAIAYAERFKRFSRKLKHLFPVMRLFLEKPRSRFGWKGFLYDPRLDGSNDIATGLKMARKLLVQMAQLEMPCATELLDPIASLYFEDLITWGIIGARTSASQPHRQMASGLPFPVGFKNGVYGELDAPIAGIASSQIPHCHFGIDEKGVISAIQTQGNPWTHLVLRGSETAVNYTCASIAHALRELEKQKMEKRLLVDCSHGNSKKNPQEQKIAFHALLEQIKEGNEAICALMLESQLYPGKQSFCNNPSSLRYGVSITDGCLGWEETEELLVSAEEALASRSMAISSVQS